MFWCNRPTTLRIELRGLLAGVTGIFVECLTDRSCWRLGQRLLNVFVLLDHLLHDRRRALADLRRHILLWHLGTPFATEVVCTTTIRVLAIAIFQVSSDLT